jgi:hypothetical protein
LDSLATLPSASDVLARARKTPLVRSAVEDLAKTASPSSQLVEEALRGGEAHAATVLAFATIAAKAPLEARVVRALLPDVEATEHVGPLVFAASGDTVELLVGFLEDGRGGTDREALALLLLALALGGAKAPDAAVRHARKLARRYMSSTAQTLLGAAAARLGDADLASLAAKDVKLATKNKRTIEETIATAKRAPLDALASAAGARVIALDYTVRKQSTAGRNDPCPCGSGKKYKKCCALKDETAVVDSPRIEDAALHPEQASALRPAQLAKLDASRLSEQTWLAAFDRALVYREWELAERMFADAAKRPDLAPHVPKLRVAMLHEAYEARNREVAERVFARLPPEEAALDALEMAFLRGEPDLLARIEQAAHAALRTEDDGAASIELGFALLRHSPALGILVARGAMHERRTNDCQILLEAMEDARDRLLLPPFEPWWDFYEGMIESAEERDEQVALTAKQQKLADELKRAKLEKRRATAELTKLKQRLDELDAAQAEEAPKARPTKARPEAEKPAAPGVVAAAAVDAKIEEERRQLRAKVAELRRIVAEGQEERRELRKKLVEAAEEEESKATPTAPRASAGQDDADERALDDDAIDTPRDVLVPRFSDRAAKALGALDPTAADAALALVAALAAGRPNAWSGTKHLTKVRSVMSARAGLYHRILFALEDRALVVLDVVPRKDLEQAVTRLAAERRA